MSSLFETEPPDGGRWTKWLGGYVFAGAVFLYGVYAIVVGAAWLPAGGSSGDFTGLTARWLGIFYLGLAARMHFHWGWGLDDRLWPHYESARALTWWWMLPSFAIFVLCAIYFPE